MRIYSVHFGNEKVNKNGSTILKTFQKLDYPDREDSFLYLNNGKKIEIVNCSLNNYLIYYIEYGGINLVGSDCYYGFSGIYNGCKKFFIKVLDYCEVYELIIK